MKYSRGDDRIIDYTSFLKSNGCEKNHSFVNLNRFFQHCMSKIRYHIVPGLNMLDVNVPMPGDMFLYKYHDATVIDIGHICCYYLCKEYVKHTHKVIKFVATEHRKISQMISTMVSKIIKLVMNSNICILRKWIFGML